MEITCTQCQKKIDPAYINVATDVAQCDACGALHKLSDLVHGVEEEQPDEREALSVVPRGSNIKLTRGLSDRLTLELPAKGFTAGMIPLVVFSIFWLGFVTVWTTFASFGFPPMALFSIPFWLVGIMMAYGIITTISESQTIELSRDSLTLTRRNMLHKKNTTWRLAEIDEIRVKPYNFRSRFSFKHFRYIGQYRSGNLVYLEMPALIFGIHSEYFFENGVDEEKRWAAKLLDFERIKRRAEF